jgi:hypothetical protein
MSLLSLSLLPILLLLYFSTKSEPFFPSKLSSSKSPSLLSNKDLNGPSPASNSKCLRTMLARSKFNDVKITLFISLNMQIRSKIERPGELLDDGD